jgi:hypothetical protein
MDLAIKERIYSYTTLYLVTTPFKYSTLPIHSRVSIILMEQFRETYRYFCTITPYGYIHFMCNSDLEEERFETLYKLHLQDRREKGQYDEINDHWDDINGIYHILVRQGYIYRPENTTILLPLASGVRTCLETDIWETKQFNQYFHDDSEQHQHWEAVGQL